MGGSQREPQGQTETEAPQTAPYGDADLESVPRWVIDGILRVEQEGLSPFEGFEEAMKRFLEDPTVPLGPAQIQIQRAAELDFPGRDWASNPLGSAEFGSFVSKLEDPATNVAYLVREMEDNFGYYGRQPGRTDDDRWRFAIARHTGGRGAVGEAQVAAEAAGFDPNLWEDVVAFLSPQVASFVQRVDRRPARQKSTWFLLTFAVLIGFSLAPIALWWATGADRAVQAAADRLRAAVATTGAEIGAEAHQVGDLGAGERCEGEVLFAVLGAEPAGLAAALEPTDGVDLFCMTGTGLSWWQSPPVSERPGCQRMARLGSSWVMPDVGLDLGLGGIEHDELAAFARDHGAGLVVRWRGPVTTRALDLRCR